MLRLRGPEYARLHQAVREFGGYTAANARSIPNYGKRYRAGEVISSSMAQSVVNQVVSKRMVKKQQMRWTPRGAHLLLQVRARILNDDLAGDFHRWHPKFTHTAPEPEKLAAAASPPAVFPALVIDFLAGQLQIADRSCVKKYAQRQQTHLDHAGKIRKALKPKDFAQVEAELAVYVGRRASVIGDSPKAIFADTVGGCGMCCCRG